MFTAARTGITSKGLSRYVSSVIVASLELSFEFQEMTGIGFAIELTEQLIHQCGQFIDGSLREAALENTAIVNDFMQKIE